MIKSLLFCIQHGETPCISMCYTNSFSPVGWGCRIHTLLLCSGVRLPQRVSYNTKQSDCEVPVMLKIWGIQSTPVLPSLPGPLWLKIVAPDRILSMGKIELNCILMLN